jgi:NADH-quinone oxidoreductase subunit E
MTFLSTDLGVSPSKVYGVATFYSHFTLQPKGKHVIKLCDGTTCHVKKSHDILNALEKHLGLTPKENTTSDMLFTLELVACLGACGLAPVVVIDDKVYGPMTPESTLALMDKIRKVFAVITKTLEERKQAYLENLSKYKARMLCGHIDDLDMEEYIANGGYAMAEKAFTQMTGEEICKLMIESGLRGRGGGGFPTGRKWELTR